MFATWNFTVLPEVISVREISLPRSCGEGSRQSYDNRTYLPVRRVGYYA